jgi:NADH-quinone oxidoreductase subunit H
MELFIVLMKVVIILFGIALHLAAINTWIERKGSALIQDRIGANRAGAYFQATGITNSIRAALPGFLALPIIYALVKPAAFGIRVMGMLGIINTLVCDAVKAISKEDFIPQGISNFLHSLAPFMAVFPVFLAFALLPFAPDFVIPQFSVPFMGATVFGPYTVRMQLFILAMGSIAVYGVALAGFSGGSKFSLLGGLRASAQMISYELAMGITFVSLIVLYGTLDLYEMVDYQARGWWGVFTQPLSFVILFIVGMAETKRGPFDLPEAESELAAGYFTEYSGMKFLLFWLGEFAEIALFAILLVLLFFGGWDIPGITLPAGVWWAALIGHVVLMAKVMFFCVLQIVIRWTLPRFRYDQLMNLGWKVLLPLSMINLLVTAFFKVKGL